MSFDDNLKNIIAWNVAAFKYLLEWVGTFPPTRENLFLFQMLKVGLNQNYYLQKLFDNMVFVPEDGQTQEAREEYEQEIEKAITQDNQILDSEYQGKWKDIKELERIYNLTKDENGTTGTSETVSGWYERLYGAGGSKGPGESPTKEGDSGK